MSTQTPATTFEETHARVQANPDSTGRCIADGEPVFFYPGTAARAPGHIYSDAGVREFKISNVCEYHFDNYFDEDAAEEEERQIVAMLESQLLEDASR